VVLGFKKILTVSYPIHVPVAVSANISRPTNPFHLVKPPTKNISECLFVLRLRAVIWEMVPSDYEPQWSYFNSHQCMTLGTGLLLKQ